MPNQGTLETIAIELTRIVEPVIPRLEPGPAQGLLAELGYPVTQAQETALAPTLGAVAAAATNLTAATRELIDKVGSGDSGAILAAGVESTLALAATLDGFVDLKNAVNGLGIGAAGVDELPERLFNLLVVSNLARVRTLPGFMEFVGVLERTVHNPDSTDPANPEFTVSRFHFDRLLAWLKDPVAQLRTLYGWGDAGFDGTLLLPKLEALIGATGMPVVYHETEVPPRLDAVLLDISAPPGLNPRGLLIGLGTQFNTGEIVLPNDDFTVKIALGLTAPTGAGVVFQPNGNVELIPPDPGTQISGEVKVGVETTGGPYVLLGTAGGSRFEIKGVGLDTGARLTWVPSQARAAGSFSLESHISDGKVLIDATSGDGFLTTILPGARVEGGFDLTVGYSTETGFYISGSSSLEVKLPLHITLGPIEFLGLTILVGFSGESVDVGLGADVSAMLGPLVAVVENMGVKAQFSFPDGGGNLGPTQLDLKFMPPRGVGLALDAGVVKGGGYLFIDPDRGEYAGALELVFSEVIAVRAIGIITTKLPDGTPGFSLLIIMTAEFGTGIQLGYGFTLLAVGGLIGLNRTMNLQALAEGVRTGAINSVMFPKDIIANAPKIISDLRTLFPPQEGIFLIGPMAKLGWGTPTLVSVALGVIIEIPGNIAILGVLRIAIPADEIAIIQLQVNFLGAIEFDKKRLYFFAALFESRVVFLTIEGEMGLLVAFGDDANFVVSVGGFHPQFSPPPLPFPSPVRIAVSLLNIPVARIRIEGYFAVTSNTVQFGARVEVFFGVSVANVQGHLAFDALFQFSPFFFIIEISASFSVKIFGAGLFSIGFRGALKGPTPWNIKGHGSISILFWDVDIEFEETWGESRETELPPIAVMELFAAELNKAESWRALLPSSSNLLVSLRRLPAADANVLHPLGVLRVSQRAVPLELTLDKVGTRKPSDVNRLSIGVLGGLERKADAFDRFAPAQFQNMSDADKLSRPAFVDECAGVDLSAAGNDTRSSRMAKRVVRYEEIIIDSNFKRFARRFSSYLGTLFNFFMNGAAVTRCELSLAVKSKTQPFAEKIAVTAESYTVAFQADNRPVADEAASFHSEASAREYLNRRVAQDSSLADAFHVIPSSEKAA